MKIWLHGSVLLAVTLVVSGVDLHADDRRTAIRLIEQCAAVMDADLRTLQQTSELVGVATMMQKSEQATGLRLGVDKLRNVTVRNYRRILEALATLPPDGKMKALGICSDAAKTAN